MSSKCSWRDCNSNNNFNPNFGNQFGTNYSSNYVNTQINSYTTCAEGLRCNQNGNTFNILYIPVPNKEGTAVACIKY